MHKFLSLLAAATLWCGTASVATAQAPVASRFEVVSAPVLNAGPVSWVEAPAAEFIQWIDRQPGMSAEARAELQTWAESMSWVDRSSSTAEFIQWIESQSWVEAQNGNELQTWAESMSWVDRSSSAAEFIQWIESQSWVEAQNGNEL